MVFTGVWRGTKRDRRFRHVGSEHTGERTGAPKPQRRVWNKVGMSVNYRTGTLKY